MRSRCRGYYLVEIGLLEVGLGIGVEVDFGMCKEVDFGLIKGVEFGVGFDIGLYY